MVLSKHSWFQLLFLFATNNSRYIGGVIGAYPQNWLPENGNYFVFVLMFAISVVLIAYPCALDLPTPKAIMVASLQLGWCKNMACL